MGLDITGYGNYGWATTTPVKSIEDAKKIKQLNEANQFGQQGSYTILIGGEIGGVKGQYPEGIVVMR